MRGLLAAGFLPLLAISSAATPVEGITFVTGHAGLYAPLREVAEPLGWTVRFDRVTGIAELNGKPFDPFSPRLTDGTCLVAVDALVELGARLERDERTGVATVKTSSGQVRVRSGPKRVLVDKSKQTLTAWQGERLVFESAVSTGREGKGTPNGQFKALLKRKEHVSSIYGSEMPYSVQVVGNIFIHGSHSFSYGPASAGCIRLPMYDSPNHARWFFNWIEVGTPVRITGTWRS
jgi:hypothetical protein